MKKVLRSLLHEQFPEDLRFKILLLSKRRDIINGEKQEELFKLLREFEIKGVVPLGSGTNRYAFKLNGFVVKVATDHDGIIDDLKEFKMAKVLYPDVAKTYEVSSDGTLLVAEYIQPFSSYAEMYQYADKIRAILKKWNDMGFLVGDVGVTPKNYANWGLRVGSDEPVCLDFAYVFDISSELFICHHCKTNSMLVPDKDYVKLLCPAKGCGAVYEFSDIRRRIGNDLHMQEIGDLREESYEMDSSNILTDLIPSKSRYLVKPETSKVEEPVEEVIDLVEQFVLDHELSYYKYRKENEIMNLNTSNMNFFGNRIKATPIIEKNDDVVFSGKIADVPVIKAFVLEEETIAQIPEDVIEVVDEDSNEDLGCYQDSDEDSDEDDEVVNPIADLPKFNPDQFNDLEVKENTVILDNTTEPVEDPVDDEAKEDNFSKKFKSNAHFAVSNIGKSVQEYLAKIIFFDKIKNCITDKKKKIYAGDFYKIISTSIYKSIVGYCRFEQIEIPNKDKSGTHRGYHAPAIISGTEYEPTMRFLERFFIDNTFKDLEYIDDIMNVYNLTYDDCRGIQREILPLLRKEIANRVRMSDNGIDLVMKEIENVLFISQEEEDVILMTEAFVEASTESVYTEDTLKKKLDAEIAASEPVDEANNINQLMAQAVREVVIDDSVSLFDNRGEVAFAGEMMQTIDSYEEESDYIPTYVKIYSDCIRLETADAYGRIVIPFYYNINTSEPAVIPSLVDDRNGEWDWLTHLAPVLRFYTNDPERWLEGVNNVEYCENQTHAVILDKLENGPYIMGLYVIDGMYIIDDEDNCSFIEDVETVKKLNKIFMDGIATNGISHLTRTVNNVEDIMEEQQIESYLRVVPSDEDEESFSNNEQAAIDALFDDADDVDDDQHEEMLFTPIRRPK